MVLKDMISNVKYDVEGGKDIMSAIDDELLSNGIDLDYEMELAQYCF